MRRVKWFALAVAVILLCGTLFTGCGKETVDLNKYVKFQVEGFDGYGKVTAYIDAEAIAKDYKEFINDEESIKTPDGRAKKGEAVAFIINEKTPFKLKYDSEKTDYKNGDVIQLTWKEKESAIEKLQEFLDVEFTHADLSYTVEGLTPIQQIDPLSDEYLTVEITGEFSGDCHMYVESKVPVGENDVCYLEVTRDKEGPYKNGDVITLSFQRGEYYEENFSYYREQYGIEFTDSQKQITIEGLDYVPLENPQEALDNISQKSYDNVNAVVENKFKDYAGEMKQELVGVAYYYAEPSVMDEKSYPDEVNKLVFVYHLENGIYPNGWYTYLVADDVCMAKLEQEDGSAAYQIVGYGYKDQGALHANSAYYSIPFNYMVYDGLYYDGYATLEECLLKLYNSEIAPYTSWGTTYERPYQNVLVTEGLQDVIVTQDNVAAKTEAAAQAEATAEPAA